MQQIKMFYRQKEWYDDILLDTVNKWILDNYNKIKVLEVILEDADTVKVKYEGNIPFERISIKEHRRGYCPVCKQHRLVHKKFSRLKTPLNNQSREEIINEILDSKELNDWCKAEYLYHKKCLKKLKK